MEIEKDPQKAIINPVRQGSIDFTQIGGMGFPFEAWEYSNPKSLLPTLRLKAPWRLLLSSLIADGSVEGITGIAYHQALCPEIMYLNDTWENTTTNQTYKVIGGDIATRKGGAPASVSPGYYYGGAPASETPTYSDWGNIPANVGWVKDGTHAGSTLIDGGQIETDSLKSHNYVPGVSGSKFDLKTGYIETGDGVFRGSLDAADGTFTGDVSISADDVGRQLELGSKGLLVKDSTGEIAHDILDDDLPVDTIYMGHLYSLARSNTYGTAFSDIASTTDYQRISTNSVTLTLSDLGLSGLSGSNIRGVKLLVHLQGSVEAGKFLATSTSGERSVMRLIAYGIYKSSSTALAYTGEVGIERDNGIHLVVSGSMDIPLSYDGTIRMSIYLGYTNFGTTYGAYTTYAYVRPVGIWA